MKPNWAEENLQTIRTLMERSALYRRALAPIMILCGGVGIVGGLTGWLLKIDSDRGFVLFWGGVAAVALIGSILLARRQALKDSEPFWSPPTRRVVQALTPPFLVGALITALAVVMGGGLRSVIVLIPVWCWSFGCAMTAAGFFMPRGIKLLGWLFILIGFFITVVLMKNNRFEEWFSEVPHFCMGGIFGGLHLAYGIYLYFTEKKNPAA